MFTTVSKLSSVFCARPRCPVAIYATWVRSKSTYVEPKSINETNIYILLDKYDTFLLDCDGVLWGSDHYTKFVGVGSAMEKIKSLGKEMFFVTNNSMHSREKYVDKIQDFTGFGVAKDDIFSVSYATALYLRQVLGVKKSCYIIGPLGLKTELELFSIATSGYGFDEDEPSDRVEILLKHSMNDDVEAVVVGFDHHFHYNKLYKAASYLSNPACHYVATNDKELSIFIGKNRNQPLTGPIIGAVSIASNRQPLVIGKPYPHLLDCVRLSKPELNLKRCLMIGDSLHTDIAFARNSVIDSALVMTGATTESSLQKALSVGDKSMIPTYVLKHFGEFGKK